MAIAFALSLGVGSASAVTQTFTTVGCANTVPANLFTVPAGVSRVAIDARGARGETIVVSQAAGGAGDILNGTLSGLSAGQVMDICVNVAGGAGGVGSLSRNAGRGGGASGVALGSDFSTPVFIAAGGGGGALAGLRVATSDSYPFT